MTAIASAVVLTHILIVSEAFWWLALVITGCLAVLYLVIESWLNQRATNSTRGLVLSVYLFISLTVIFLGQLMVLLYDPKQFELFLLASVLVSIAAVPLGLREPAEERIRFAEAFEAAQTVPQSFRLELRRQ